MRFVKDFIKSVALVVRVVNALVVLMVFVPHDIRKAIKKMATEEVITKEQALDFYQDYIRAGGRFYEVSRLSTLADLAQLAGFDNSIAGVGKFCAEYMD